MQVDSLKSDRKLRIASCAQELVGKLRCRQEGITVSFLTPRQFGQSHIPTFRSLGFLCILPRLRVEYLSSSPTRLIKTVIDTFIWA